MDATGPGKPIDIEEFRRWHRAKTAELEGKRPPDEDAIARSAALEAENVRLRQQAAAAAEANIVESSLTHPYKIILWTALYRKNNLYC